MTPKKTATPKEIEAAKQISLLPEQAPKGKFQRLALDVFKRMNLVGPAPKRSFVETIRHADVFEPIIVFKDKQGKFKVGDGIRRITAALECEKKDIPAMVYEDEEAFRLAITLIANNQRSANPLAEVRAIMRLQKKNFSPEKIAEETGMPIQRIRERLRLNNLIKPLYDGMFSGKIAVSFGQEACKQPAAYQHKLAKVFKAEGKVKMHDLREVKNTRQASAMAAVPAQIFAPAPEPAPQGNGKQPEGLKALLDAVKAFRAVVTSTLDNISGENVDVDAVRDADKKVGAALAALNGKAKK